MRVEDVEKREAPTPLPLFISTLCTIGTGTRRLVQVYNNLWFFGKKRIIILVVSYHDINDRFMDIATTLTVLTFVVRIEHIIYGQSPRQQ
jgi:hypothetical protein